MNAMKLDGEQFRRTYHEFIINVAGKEQRIFGEKIVLRQWVVIPMADTDDMFLVDTGGFGGNAFQMRVDFETNRCFRELSTESKDWPLLGTLERSQ